MFGIYRFFIYLCGRYKGCLDFVQAEIIPMEPETGNADEGKCLHAK